MDLRKMLSGGKAFPATPMLLDNSTPAVIRGQDGNRRKARLTQREAKRHLQAYGGSDSIDWVMNCVRLIADTAGGADYFFEKNGQRLEPKKGPHDPEDTKYAPKQLAELIERPNPYCDYEEYIELLMIDLLLVGNCYWYKFKPNEKGQPLALYRLAPPFVSVVPGEYGVQKYIYDVEGQRKPLELSPDDVIHFKLTNPHNPFLGLGVIQGGARPLDLELALTETQASYYENHAQPSMVVQSDRRVPRDVFRKLQSQLRGRVSGPRNAGELLLLEAGLKYQAISPDATEAAFQPLTKLSRDRIAAMFRVPVSLVAGEPGTVAGESANAQRQFDTKTMRPLLNRVQKAISQGLTQAWGVDFKIEHDYIMPIEDRVKLTSAFASIPGIKVREVREFAGLPPLGDENDELILNVPGEEGTEEDPRNGFPDPNAAGEAGRPPRPENTKLFPAPGEPLPAGSRARRPRDARRPSERGKAMDIGEVLNRFEAIEGKAKSKPKVSKPEDKLKDIRDPDIDAIVADAAKQLADDAHVVERKMLDALEGKAAGSDILKRIKSNPVWKAFQNQITRTLEDAIKRALSTAVVHEGTQGRVAEEDIDYDEIAKRLVHRREGVERITKNLRDELVKKVGDALQKGADRTELDKAIREAVAGWKENQSELIALTEATIAYNEGTVTVAEKTGHTHVAVTDGRDFDEPCQKADGQIWTLEQARAHPLEHPRCRRAFIPILSEQ